jgi:hypothetical protein
VAVRIDRHESIISHVLIDTYIAQVISSSNPSRMRRTPALEPSSTLPFLLFGGEIGVEGEYILLRGKGGGVLSSFPRVLCDFVEEALSEDPER